MKKREPLELEAPEHLTDADWVVLNRIADIRSSKARMKAFKELAGADPERFGRMMLAVDPVMMREAALDAAAELDLDVNDLREDQDKPHLK
jgi:hypothetical protein